MALKREHEYLLHKLVDAAEANGITPEQIGATLQTAVSERLGRPWASKKFDEQERREINTARVKVRELIGTEDAETLFTFERS